MTKLSDLKLWWYFFLYTFFVSFAVQFILLPYILPSLHAGNGLLTSSFDSRSFHQIAIDLADKIRTQGWSAWQLRPRGQVPAGIGSVFYFFILPDPRIFIPITSALHASAALILVNCTNLLLKNKAKSILCVLPFLVFPSNLQWTAQWHRDGFAILGVILILQALILLSQLAKHKVGRWIFNNFISIGSFLCGFFLIWLGRPYILKIVSPFVMLFFLLLFIITFIRLFKREMQWENTLLFSISILSILFIISKANICCDYAGFGVSVQSLEDRKSALTIEDYKKITAGIPEDKKQDLLIEAYRKIAEEVLKSGPAVIEKATPEITPKPAPAAIEKITLEITPKPVKYPPTLEDYKNITADIPENKKQAFLLEAYKKIAEDVPKEQLWENLKWFPTFINSNAYSLAQSRSGFRFSGGKSIIDSNIGFGNVIDLLIYLPRAAQIVFLAPFPNQWLEEGSLPANILMRRASAFEMIIVYFFLLFLPYALWHWRKRIEIWLISTFCFYIMLVYGLVVCNIGSLYRMRYVYIMVLVALGVAGFIVFLNDIKSKLARRHLI